MARKWRRESLENETETETGAEHVDADAVEPSAPDGDSSFEAAQQLLQAAVAEIRGYEITVPDDAEDTDEAGAHRRWRRRMHAEGHSGEHQAIPPTEATAPEPLDEPALFEPALFEPALAEAAAAAAAEVPADELDEVAAATAARTANRRVPRRRRGGSRPSTISSPTADYVLAIEQPESSPGGPVDEDTAASGRGRRILVASLVALLVVAGIAVAVTTSGSDDEVASPPAKVAPRLAFDKVTTTDGVVVARVWRLSGSQGSEFTGSLAFTNPTSSAVKTTFTEVIPKSLAPTVADITFDPQPVIVKADPVVQYTVTVDPGATFRATYEITVPADGASRSRLLTWADDLARETGTTTTTTPRTVPTTAAPPPTTPSSTPPSTPAATTPRTTPTNPTPTQPLPPPTTPPEPPPTTAPPVIPGSIVVRVSGAPGTYNFSNGVSLTVGGSGSTSTGAMSVDPGLYPWTMTSGSVSNIDCSDRDSGPFENRSTVSIPERRATFNVQPGEFIACTWFVSEP